MNFYILDGKKFIFNLCFVKKFDFFKRDFYNILHISAQFR